MRKAIYAGDAEEGRALFSRAPEVHLALVSGDGRPILRTVDAVVVDGALALHGAPAGEKMDGLGGRVVASAHETVATIPSYLVDPERACPATTYYVGAQAHGVLAEVHDPERKARILTALMAKYQPEGGHVPIAHDHPLYAKALRGLLVAEVQLDQVTCKVKLGQNRTPADRVRVLEGLWRRGAPGDAAAIALVLARFPDLPAPTFLPSVPGLRPLCHVPDSEIGDAVELLHGAYWLADVPREKVALAIARSSARVGVRDDEGRLVAFARAVSDERVAWIYDVVVCPDRRGGSLGRALVSLLLDHPEVRRARAVRLGTRDAAPFYEKLGFADVTRTKLRAYPVTEMVRTSR